MRWVAERNFSEQDRTWVRVLAAQCAQAIERTQLLVRQRDVAETLQQAMLPDELPDLPGLAVSACYLPAATDLTVGGDWYDAFALPDGRLVVAVGDVSGHGVQAAAVMGQVRNALRAYVVEGHDPASALTRLDELVDHAGHVLFATAVVAVYEPATGELTWSAAGHPPLVVRAGSGVALLEGHLGAPLGVLGPTGHHNNRTLLEVGDFIVAYTDGLVERRQENLTVGFARLVKAVEGAGRVASSEEWCRDLIDAVLGDHPREDDICVLVLQRT